MQVKDNKNLIQAKTIFYSSAQRTGQYSIMWV